MFGSFLLVGFSLSAGTKGDVSFTIIFLIVVYNLFQAPLLLAVDGLGVCSSGCGFSMECDEFRVFSGLGFSIGCNRF